jgi:AcrR family transcriptional regulator
MSSVRTKGVVSPSAAKKPADDSARQAILQAALRVLVEEGHGALTVRRVANVAGVSTIGVYTWFGGKDGLVDAIWIDGFHSFANSLRRAASGKAPIENMCAQATAYRRWALAHPMHYRVMFLGAMPGHQPSAEAAAAGTVAYELIESAVSAAADQGLLVSNDVSATTMMMWGLVHGLVALQLVAQPPVSSAKQKDLNKRAFDHAIAATVRGITRT